ncbi:MAG: 4Fe-4S dicluster domain-containing protein [Spirochaetes bacterium]|nr:4Fe-4S dicluster domain-containing protein [Spirochaetota bacterium]
MKRQIIQIDESKCNGCGLCIPNCPEGALRIIDGKVRLISDLFCDGLGACIGHCPEGAITIEEREAEAYDEKQVMKNIIPQGKNVIIAHLSHLMEHGEREYLQKALDTLKEENIMISSDDINQEEHYHGCPGTRSMNLSENNAENDREPDTAPVRSELINWPVQMHLISPRAPYFKGSDVLLSADCAAFSLGDFHRKYLKGKSLIIACPKLDTGQEIYLEKLTALIDMAKINTLTVMTMEVPCCNGLLNLAQRAVAGAEGKIPLKWIVVSVRGGILKEEWV